VIQEQVVFQNLKIILNENMLYVIKCNYTIINNAKILSFIVYINCKTLFLKSNLCNNYNN